MILSSAISLSTALQPINVVLIFSDDHARQAISAYGSKLIQTPHIDALAKRGVLFERHYTSNPICAPSRASLLTGKHSHVNGHRDNAVTFDGSQETFPKLLQTAGYETAAFGKWHLVSNPTGFDTWQVLPGQGAYYNPEFITPTGKIKEDGYTTEIISRKAMDWLKAKREKPFFLLVGHKAPHRNWQPGPKQLNLFNETVFPEPKTLRTDHDSLTSAAKAVHMRLDRHIDPKSDLMVDFTPRALTEAQAAVWQKAYAPQDLAYHDALKRTNDLLGTNYQRYLKQYLRCVQAVDDSVGEIVSALKTSGLDKRTVIIYASDQGFFLGENAWYDKRWFYEPSAGTPLVVAAPGHRAIRVQGGSENVDLAPTILDLAGVTIPEAMQGRSLKPWMEGARLSDQPAYGHFYESTDGDHKAPKYTAIATSRHKLIFYYELGEWELFDLAADPDETRNLWKTAPRELRSEMVRKLIARQREVKEDAALIRLTAESHPRHGGYTSETLTSRIRPAAW